MDLGVSHIDTRVSFNFFTQRPVRRIIKKLTNYYLELLEKKPQLHDKIEFDITFSCYTFDLKDRLKALKQYFFTESEIITIHEVLKNLTDNIIHEKRIVAKRYSKNF